MNSPSSLQDLTDNKEGSFSCPICENPETVDGVQSFFNKIGFSSLNLNKLLKYYSLQEIISIYYYSNFINKPVAPDVESFRDFERANNVMKDMDFNLIVSLYQNKNFFKINDEGYFHRARCKVFGYEKAGEFLSLLLKYLIKNNKEISIGELYFLYLLYSSNEGVSDKVNVFDEFDNLNEKLKSYKIDLSSEKVTQKLYVFCKYKDMKNFRIKNLKLIFGYFIINSDNPLDDFEDLCFDADLIYNIDVGNESLLNLLYSLNTNFGISGKRLIPAIDSGLTYDDLLRLINLFNADNFLKNRGIKPSDLNWGVNEIKKVLSLFDDNHRLLYISKSLFELSQINLDESMKGVSSTKNLDDEYVDNPDTKYIEKMPKLSGVPLDRYNKLLSIIELLEKQNEALLKCLSSLSGKINGMVDINLGTISETQEKIQDLLSRARMANTSAALCKHAEIYNECEDFFCSGVTLDNYHIIFDKFVDIVFNPEYCDHFLSLIPDDIINTTSFFDEALNVSFPDNVSFPYNFYRISHIFKYLKGEVLDYAFNRMSESGHMDIMFYECTKGSSDVPRLYSYIFGKVMEMRAVDKVLILPSLSRDLFQSDDQYMEFINDIIINVGFHCLYPYFEKIPYLKGLGIYHYYSAGDRTFFNIFSNLHKYYKYCRNSILFKEGVADNVYTLGSGTLSGTISHRDTKFVLYGTIYDTKNVSFVLSTDFDDEKRSKTSFFSNPYDGCLEEFGSGYVKKVSEIRTIYLYGPIPENLIGIISDILRKKFFGFDIVVGNLAYKSK